MAKMRFISTHIFQTASGENWPNQRFDGIFGACRVVHGVHRVSRNLHGYNIVIASGKFLEAHAARLSDMVEIIFGKYRLEPARAKFNFSRTDAALDVAEREPLLTAVLKEFEQLLLEKGVLPPAEHMEAIRKIVTVRGAAISDAARLRRANTEILKEKVAAFEKRVQTLEDAAAIRLDEMDEKFLAISKQLKELGEHLQKVINNRVVGVELRCEEVHKNLAKLDLEVVKKPKPNF